MSRSFSRTLIGSMVACLAALFAFSVPSAWGQGTTVGSVHIAVLDQSGATVPDATLALRNLDTNSVSTGTTGRGGLFAFPSLPFGTFELTVSKPGFKKQVLSSVIVEAGRVTDVKVILQVGAASEEVVVTGTAAPLQTDSSAIASTVDMKQINDLPIGGRNVSGFVYLTPGFSGVSGYGTWDGLPLIAQSNTVDGIVANTNRMKFNGNATPAMSARLEDIGEMTIQTSQQSVSQGFGEASMGAAYLTRGGSNTYHGEAFEDFRNTVLNANSWDNNEQGFPRDKIILNEFGGNVGGPILKNKLFFFGSFSMSKQPGGRVHSRTFLSPAAQTGIYTLFRSQPNGSPFTQGETINLFTQVAAPNGLPASVNNPPACSNPCPNTYANIASEIALVNKDLTETNPIISPTGDPNTESVRWFVPSARTFYYPAIRLDYNATQNVRMNFEFEETRFNQPGATAPYYPGPDFASQSANNRSKNYTSSLGINWTISPTLVNEFRVGYLYTFGYNAGGAKAIWDTQPAVNWALGNSGQEFNLNTATFYPTISGGDTLTWLHGAHTFAFGFSYTREQDHYYNAPDGIPSIDLALRNGDVARTDFENYFNSGTGANTADKSEAENLYATLVGRISGVGPIGSGFPYDPTTNAYASTPGGTVFLDELQRSWGVFFHDSYHLNPSLTLNYGLRWDFIGDDHDLAHQYLGTPLSSFYGPSGVDNIFNPGVLVGTNTPVYAAASHQYGSWNVTPQPTIGVAWNPNYSEGLLARLFGNGKTVVRAGFDLKRFTEPNQYFWNFGTNHGTGYFQRFSLTAANSGATGTFAPGSLTVGDAFGTGTAIPYALAPAFYQKVIPQSDLAWTYYWGEAGFDPNIKQPYVQEWNLGIQRQIGPSSVLEIRYVGHRSVHQWLSVDPNEVNIFENGFLNEFKNAQTNLAINQTHGITSFANNGYAGQQALPIFDAAFAGEASGGAGVPLVDYANGAFITDLQQGGAGDLAYNLSSPYGTVPYICNLVGSSVTPCANGEFASATAPGQYPANFFQANPYGASCLYCSSQEFMTNGGYGNYNGLVVDFRQRPWHGMEFDANYTYSHTLGIQPDTQWLGTTNQFTVRNLRSSYGPTLFDIRHVVHILGTYDLPFGTGKRFFNSSGVLDKIVGGWTVGTIFQYETGFPFQLTGGYSTYNDYADGGLAVSAATLSQLQKSVGVYHPKAGQYPNLPLGPWAYTINPALLAASQTSYTPPANCTSALVNVCQNTSAGTLTGDPWLHGPHLWNDDMSLTKVVPITERIRFVFQGEALNVFNHPEWANPNSGVQGSDLGQSGLGGFSGPRQLELRARIDF
ncbi:MAG: carboxypeptidase regulatory-like domain-containing protein [Candidatus Acidiferrales bacterium]